MPKWTQAGKRLICAITWSVAGCTGSAGLDVAGQGRSQAPPVMEPAPTINASKCAPQAIQPGPAPLRRLTRFEYDNTVRDLLGDDTRPARALPSEEIGNGFGNDARAQSVSSLLVEQYGRVADDVAERATATPQALAKLDPCATTVSEATEGACAEAIIEKVATGAYRRSLAAEEVAELVALFDAAREGSTFATGIATVIAAVLQSPDFLYRVEFGVPDAAQPGVRRVSGDEMATRLSYFLWATTPDAQLRAAAAAGELSTAEGVRQHATRMVDDPRARPVLRFFFDNLLPLAALAHAERDPALFPTWSPEVGAHLREETQRLLEYEIFEGSGTWSGAITAPYTFLNGPLATFYGVSGISGETFQKVPVNASQRLGILTQAGVMLGTTHSNHTNPVSRGAFVVRKLLCRNIPLPTGDILDQIKPPDPYSGATARERFSAHREQAVCASCHQLMDPIGLAFENYDPVGLYRTQENGVTIDATGGIPGIVDHVGNARGLLSPMNALSFENNATFEPIPPRLDPVQIWNELFGGLAEDAETAAKLRRKKSILDFVDRKYDALSRRVGAADRQKLEQHLTKIRELELALDATLNETAICKAPTLVDTSDYNPDPSINESGGSTAATSTDAAIPKVGRLMTDMLVMAMACDITAVATLQWTDTEAKHTFPWLSLGEHHHYYQHDGGFRPAECEKIYTWYSQQHLHLLQSMAQVDMGGHSLLDETVVFFGSELQDPPSHSKANMPFLLAGGGGLRTGRWVKYNDVSHNNLLLALLNLFGDPRTSFGDPNYCTGPLPNLT